MSDVSNFEFSEPNLAGAINALDTLLENEPELLSNQAFVQRGSAEFSVWWESANKLKSLGASRESCLVLYLQLLATSFTARESFLTVLSQKPEVEDAAAISRTLSNQVYVRAREIMTKVEVTASDMFDSLNTARWQDVEAFETIPEIKCAIGLVFEKFMQIKIASIRASRGDLSS